MEVKTLVKNNSGKDTVVLSFRKVFVILQYNSDEVPLSSELPNVTWSAYSHNEAFVLVAGLCEPTEC